MTYRRPRSLALPLCALLGLSACTNLGLDRPTAPSKPSTGAESHASPTVAAPPPPRPATKPGVELNALRPAPRPSDTAPEPTGTPKLVGLSEEETMSLLGRPAEEAVQPPGKVWIYRAAGCQLSVHLFPDMERGGFYALDYAADSGRDACLGKVAGEARKRGGALANSAKVG